MVAHCKKYGHRFRKKNIIATNIFVSAKTTLDVNVIELDSALRWYPLHHPSADEIGQLDSQANLQVSTRSWSAFLQNILTF